MTSNPLLITGIALLAAGTFLMRFVSSRLGHRIALPDEWQQRLSDAATTLLLAVALIATFYQEDHFAGFARLCGVGVAVLLTLRKLPLIVVIVASAAVTAVLRYCGVH